MISYWVKTRKFGIYFTFAGGKYRSSFATFAAAKERLDREFSKLDCDRANSLTLHPINHDVKTYHELEQLLRERANGATLREVVEFYLVHHEHKRFAPKTVTQCIESFLQNEIASNVSPSHARTLKRHLKHFERTFGSTLIHKISAEQIARWLNSFRSDDGSPWGATTRRQVRGSLVSLSLYAQKILHALPDLGKTEFQNVKRPKREERGEVEIYTPAEISTLLAAAIEYDIDLIPGIVVGCFQGLRPDEFHAENAKREPLKWEAINWHDKVFSVRGQKVRSKPTRPIPLHPVSEAWLEPFRGLSGAIWRYTRAYDDKLKTLFGKAGLDRRYDAFRHSYASYRLRHLKQSLDLLAAEMGNSPREIVDSYKCNVSDVEADAWFGVLPPADYAERIKAALDLRQAA